ncbi:MAG: hypothetical protein ACJA1A_000038 [Saprospiraceae bacterium]
MILNKKLDVKHYLGIYQLRKNMQDLGVVNPSKEIKIFTSELVERLTKLPMEEGIEIINHSFIDSKGNLILKIPQIE